MANVSSAVLFDLDGVLVQTRESSWELFHETSRKFNLGVDDRDAFFGLFEDNFFRSLARRCPDPIKLAEVKGYFLDLLRSRYRPELIPGMADVVRALAPHFTLAILSTNTMATIRRLLTEAGIAHCFAHVFAGDVEPDKSVSIRRFLADPNYGYGRSCSPAYREGEAATRPTADGVVLVTDTVGDVKEALSCGIRSVGVAWGMHTDRQLLAAGAEMVAIWPQELVAWLLGQRSDADSAGCGCTTQAAASCARPASKGPAAEGQTCGGQTLAGSAQPTAQPLALEAMLAEAAQSRRRRMLQSRMAVAPGIEARPELAAAQASPQRSMTTVSVAGPSSACSAPPAQAELSPAIRIDPVLLAAIRRIVPVAV